MMVSMKTIYERCVELIGKSDDDPLFLALVNDSAKLPQVMVKDAPLPLSRCYVFTNLYLAVFAYFEEEAWIIRAATMSSDGGALDSDLLSRLGGLYPFGILPQDDLETIRRKIGAVPTKEFSRVMADVEIWREEYDLPSVHLDLHFNHQGGDLMFWLVSHKKAKRQNSF